jgi:hypothetical protein
VLVFTACGQKADEPTTATQTPSIEEVSNADSQVAALGFSVNPKHDTANANLEKYPDADLWNYAIIDGEIAQVTYTAEYVDAGVNIRKFTSEVTVRAKRTEGFEDLSGFGPSSFSQDKSLGEGNWGILRYNEVNGEYQAGYAAWYNDDLGLSVSVHVNGPGPLHAIAQMFYDPT